MSGAILEVTPCDLSEVLLITPRTFADSRGFFVESYNARLFESAGIVATFVQDNHSRSTRGVVRGLHYQLPHAQAKLVRVVRGAIFDVVVDIRVGSPTFAKWVGLTLDDERKQSLWIPAGFAHGFCVLSTDADVTYKATDFYVAAAERGIAWNDPGLTIDWPVTNPILSPKDRTYAALSLDRNDLPTYEPSV